LNYAEKNRQEWKECGEDVVREMLENVNKKEVHMVPMAVEEVEEV
jgi:hypothetical protein